MIATMLFEIGEEWNRGALSVDAEHRFTAFSERVIRLIKSRIAADGTARFVSSKATPLFLMNAPGNRHNLAVDILALWLESRGATVWIIDQRVDNAGLMRAVETERPRYLLISMALSEQRDGVAEISKAIQALPQEMRPKIIVGGDPMKAGLIKEIPAAELLSDISAFHLA